MSQRRIMATIVLIAIVAAVIIVVVIVRSKRDDPQITVNGKKSVGAIHYLPLGDSYTIGTSVKESERWPNQLSAMAQANGSNLQILDNPARLGYTSQDLIDRELPLVAKTQPDLVSVLIGVNDYVQGVPTGTFSKNLQKILDTLQLQIAQPKNIFLVTIPDYAKTPAGAQYGDPSTATKAIEQFNEIIKQAGAERNLTVVDIFPISQKVTVDASLTASDGLHPSGIQYGLWTQQIYEALKQQLLSPAPPSSVR